MSVLLDTNVAIELRNGEPRVSAKVAVLTQPVVISVVTLVELEGGGRTLPQALLRRRRLARLLVALEILSFGEAEAAAYGQIMDRVGYSRRKVLDRMIAAQALVRGASVLTLNPADFADVPGLTLEPW